MCPVFSVCADCTAELLVSGAARRSGGTAERQEKYAGGISRAFARSVRLSEVPSFA